jgi:diguanylate cyclase (GGDEF)-like protein/hemerythrin-like metal-binding protein
MLVSQTYGDQPITDASPGAASAFSTIQVGKADSAVGKGAGIANGTTLRIASISTDIADRVASAYHPHQADHRDAPIMPGIAIDVPSETDMIGAATVSRMLTSSRAIPVALARKGKLVFANAAFLELFHANVSIVGMAITDLIASHGHAAMGKLLSDPIETQVTFQERAIRLDGSSFDVELLMACETLDGVPTLCVFAADVTWRRLFEKHLSSLAFTDTLTGLPNRARILDRLRNAIVEARGNNSGLAVFMADLDGLKRTNDTFGHQTGDVVLQVLAQRFQECMRDHDMLARLGGDEFCVVLPKIRKRSQAEAIAARLVEVARQPISINDQNICVGVSVGIALFPAHGTTGDALIAASDAALYEAKRGGRSCFAVASVPVHMLAVSLPLIIWSAAYDVGIEMIDKEHRQLAKHVNDFASSLRRGDDPATIADKLAALFSYTQYHFESEERLMLAHGFADAATHREIHARFLDDLRSFSVGCDTRSLSLTTRFLQEWLLRHIDGADRKLATELRARGVH